MELISLQACTAPGGLAELPQLAFGASPMLFDGSQLRQIRRYARCGLELPLGLYASLAVMDAACGQNTHRFLFELKDHCRQWDPLEADLLRAGDELSNFGTRFSIFCIKVSKQIRALPVQQRAVRCGQDEGWRLSARKDLAALEQQTAWQRESCGRLLQRMDKFRETMDNTIVPGSGAVLTALERLEPLELKAGGVHVSVPHCGFLEKDPVIQGFVRDLKNARDDTEAARIRESLVLTAQPIWERMLTAFSGLNEAGAAVADAAAGVRNMDVLWAAVARYLDEVKESLAHAEEASRLLLLANDLDSCADSWGSIAGYGAQLHDALNEAESK